MERVIKNFNEGLLDAAPGTTLRNYLSSKLNCDPMRITKKFTGESSIGKRVFHPTDLDRDALETARQEVADLEAKWRQKLENIAKEQSKESSEQQSSKRKPSDDDESSWSSTESKRRKKKNTLSAQETKRYDLWLKEARAAVDATPDSSALQVIDALLVRGQQLRRDLDHKQKSFSMEDDEANGNLLVDFLRSARQQLQHSQQQPT